MRDSNQTDPVTPQALPAIVWQGAKVITTELLAKLYGCSEKNLADNYANNRDRFEEGKHFIKLQGEQLKALKNQPEIIGLVAKRTSHLILWTERGAARHAKMLETNAAWEVFEQLEDCYFTTKARPPLVDGNKRSNVRDRRPLYLFAVEAMIRHGLPFSTIYRFMNLFAGSRSFRQMTKAQSVEVADFCDRFMLSQDTRNDWQRITDNQARLHGESPQQDMVQKLLLS
ncbi:ORF6N domain-containing protein [Delftia acidovorans]